MANPQVQPAALDTRVASTTKKTKKREFKNRKTFSLKAMEALVDRIGFLKNKYDALSINAQEKLGYHYNEILNILLFHKYVKDNKKLFDMYKKIKDAVNKGYEFKKEKKVQENTMKNMINENKATHFAINKKNNKILESWDYEGYDHSELKNYKHEFFSKDIKMSYPQLNENDVLVVTKSNLHKRNLNESSKSNWQKYTYTHFALLKETNHILYGYNYEDLSQDELNKNKNKYFLNILKETYGSEITPKDVIVVKSSKLPKLGVKNFLKESNWVGLINEAYCGSNMDEMIDEDDSKVYGSFNGEDWYDEKENSYKNNFDFDYDEETFDDFNSMYTKHGKNTRWFAPGQEGEKYFNMYKDRFGSMKVRTPKNIDEESIDEDFGGSMATAFPVSPAQPTGGYPVANPNFKVYGDGKRRGFDMSKGQDMFKAKNMLPSVKNGIKKYQSEFSNPTFKQTTEPEFITPVKTTHFQGTKKKAMKEGYDLVDLNALMNDEIEYKKINENNNPFKSTKVELIRENNRDSIIEFILKHQGHELPEFYNKRQLNTLSLRTLNEYYSRLVQRLDLLNEEKKHDAMIRLDALKNQSKNDSNNYYKKDASTKTTTMLVQNGEGDGLTYDKDSRQRKDIPKYKYQEEHQQDYLEKIHRGLEDFVPENQPNGEVDPQWEARKKALMSTQEVGAKAYDNATKRINKIKDNKIGTNKAVLLQKDLPKVDKKDKALKENKFTLVRENDILNQVQSYYIDDENNKKPVIFDSTNVIEMVNENKLNGCKELIYKGLGQTLSEDFKHKVLNKKLLYSPESKKVYVV